MRRRTKRGDESGWREGEEEGGEREDTGVAYLGFRGFNGGEGGLP